MWSLRNLPRSLKYQGPETGSSPLHTCNKFQGMRKKGGLNETIPAVMLNHMPAKESRQNSARLIQKIYEVDPLVCPRCQGEMKIISFMENFDVIKKIFRISIFGTSATMTPRFRNWRVGIVFLKLDWGITVDYACSINQNWISLW